jgi:threonine dehydrogenase-like Zn-dependent dehydrogenase
LFTLQAFRLHGASKVFIAERDPARLAMGAALGGEPLDSNTVDPVKAVRDATDGLGALVSVDAVGTAETRKQCISATRSAGTMILCGLHEETSAMPAAEIIRREIVVSGSFAYTPANFAEALSHLASGAMKLDPWIVEAPLAEGGSWFDRLLDSPGNVSKVLLVP